MEQRQEARQLEATHPIHPHHPSHPDNHPTRKHHAHAPLLKTILVVYLIATIAIFMVTGWLTDAPFGNVLLSFAPTMILVISGLALLVSDHFDIRYFTLIFCFLLVLAGIVYSTVLPGVDVIGVVALNILLGALLLLLVSNSYAHHSHPEQQPKTERHVLVEVEGDQQDLSSLFEQITEKSKQINVVIGRVYSQYNGGTDATRKKVRIPREWYSELDTEKKSEHLKEVLEELNSRAKRLDEPETDVFTPAQLRSLKELDRKSSGHTPVIDVLAENESKTIKQTHAELKALIANASVQL